MLVNAGRFGKVTHHIDPHSLSKEQGSQADVKCALVHMFVSQPSAGSMTGFSRPHCSFEERELVVRAAIDTRSWFENERSCSCGSQKIQGQ